MAIFKCYWELKVLENPWWFRDVDFNGFLIKNCSRQYCAWKQLGVEKKSVSANKKKENEYHHLLGEV